MYASQLLQVSFVQINKLSYSIEKKERWSEKSERVNRDRETLFTLRKSNPSINLTSCSAWDYFITV